MATVGEAQVRIVADARGFARDVERQVNRAIRNVDVDTNPIANGIRDGLTQNTVQRAVTTSGRNSGRRWIEQFGIVLQGGISPRAAGAFGGVVLAALGPVLVTVGTLIGGLLITGMGAAIAGSGLFFAAEAAQVQTAFSETASEIQRLMRGISRPLQRPLEQLGDGLLATFERAFLFPLARAFSDLAGPLEVFFRDMGRAFETLAPTIVPITDAFIKILEELGPELANDVFPDLADAVINLADAIGDNADTFVDILGWFLAIPEALINFLAELTRIAGWFQDNPAFIVAAFAIIGAAVGVLIAGPIGLLVGAILGLVFAFINMRDAVGRVWDQMVAIVVSAVATVAAFLTRMWTGARAIFDLLASHVRMRLDAVSGFFANLGRTVSTIWSNIRTGADNLVSFFRNLPSRIGSAVSGIFSGLWTSFRDAVNRIIRGWNNLSFTIGGGSYDPLGIFGPTISVPSFTFNTPNIPQLQTGGIIERAGTVMVGENGPEFLTLPQGAAVSPLPAANGTGLSDEFEATAVIDLGQGIQEAIALTFRRVSRGAMAGAGRG